MPTLDLSTYKPSVGAAADANQIANGFQAIQNIVNALDSANFAAGSIFDPSKLMQNAAAVGQALAWNGGSWAPASVDPTKLAQGGAATGNAMVWGGAAWAPGFPAGANMVKIADTTLGGDAAFDFTSIPGTYAHLLLLVYGRGSAASTISDLTMRFNGDSGANYVETHVFNTNATVAGATSISQSVLWPGPIPGASAAANKFGAHAIFIPHYAGATNHKSLIAIGGTSDNVAANSRTGTAFSAWANAAAVTRIQIAADSGFVSLKAGSRATLYGLGVA